MFAQARYYLPEIGRFISEDSYKGTLDDTQSQHRYIYCANNPLKYIDPSGHMGYKSGYVDPYNSFINYADQNWENMVTTGLEKMKTTAVEVMVNIPGVDTVNDATVFITGYDLGLQKQSRAWAVAGIVAPVSGQTMKKGAKIVDKIPGVNKFRSEIVKKVKAKLGKKGTKPKKVEAKGKDDAHFGENNGKPETGKTKGKVNTNFTTKKLQHEFKHAKDFGITGNWNKETCKKYEEAIKNHIDNADEIYMSNYRGEKVNVFINRETGIGAYTDLNGNYIGGWKFSKEQLDFHAVNGIKIK